MVQHIERTATTTSKNKKDINSVGDYLPEQLTNDDSDSGSVACLR